MKSIVEFIKEENKFLFIKLIIVFIVTAIIGGTLSYLAHNFENCTIIEKRLADLNELFAREILLNSTQTLNFELSKIKSEFQLEEIQFKKEAISSSLGCDFFKTDNTYNFYIHFSREILGSLKVATNSGFDKRVVLIYLFPVVSILLILFYLINQYRKKLVKMIVTPVQKFSSQTLSLVDVNSPEVFSYNGNLSELSRLNTDLNLMITRLSKISDENLALQKYRTAADVASKVSHDIRSPLASLYMVTRNMPNLPEEQRLLIRNSVNRIQDITNDLLSKKRTTAPQNLTEEWLIAGAIEEIISEKRNKFRSKADVFIEFDQDMNIYSLSTYIDKVSFKRILSNIIDNSVEAISINGMVVVKLSKNDNGTLDISVADNGIGIPTEIINKIGVEQITFGKEDGNGLGLLTSISFIESIGGSFKIESHKTSGTKISITIPSSKPPTWLCREIIFNGSTKVIILDDDISIHSVWKRRFESISLDQIYFFTEIDSVLTFISEIDSNYICLVDYEIIGDTRNGIDLILNNLDIDKSILVTSRFEEESVVDECLKKNIPMIPKSLAEFVPISLQEVNFFKSRLNVLIDDDKYLSYAWIKSAKESQIELKYFSSIHDFVAVADSIPLDSVFFIDNYMDGRECFHIIIKDLYFRGFRNFFSLSEVETNTIPFTQLDKKIPPWGDSFL